MISAIKVVIESLGALVVYYFSTILTVSSILFAGSAVLATFRQSRMSGKISNYGIKLIILSIKIPVEFLFSLAKFVKPSFLVIKEEVTQQSKQYYNDYKSNEESKKVSKAQSAEEVLELTPKYESSDRKVVSMKSMKQKRSEKLSSKEKNGAKSVQVK